MRHNRDEKRFDRTWSHVRAMMANMTNDLVNVGRIKTTTQRAKVLRSYAEKMITLGKDGSLAARRRAMAFLRDKHTVTKLFAEVAPQYKERNGGYTRILKLGMRPGDNASMSFIELVEGPAAKAAEASASKPAKKSKAPAKKAAAKAPAKKAASAAEKGEKPARTRKPAVKKEATAPTEKKPRASKKTNPAE